MEKQSLYESFKFGKIENSKKLESPTNDEYEKISISYNEDLKDRQNEYSKASYEANMLFVR